MYRKNDLPGFLKHTAPEPDEKGRIISALENISADTLVCQGCGKYGCMKPHGTYKRGITYEQNGENKKKLSSGIDWRSLYIVIIFPQFNFFGGSRGWVHPYGARQDNRRQ